MDIADFHLRLLMLHSYDNNEQLRYGFSLEEIDWIKEELENVPEDYRILICSHDAPLARLDYWAKEIRNGEMLFLLIGQIMQIYLQRIKKEISI